MYKSAGMVYDFVCKHKYWAIGVIYIELRKHITSMKNVKLLEIVLCCISYCTVCVMCVISWAIGVVVYPIWSLIVNFETCITFSPLMTQVKTPLHH